MTPVVLRTPRPAVFRNDPQPDQPHRQTAQSARGHRTERRSVVVVHHIRQTILQKSPFIDPLHMSLVGPVHDLAAEQIPAVGIGDGQRIDARAVTYPKRAFEIAAPHHIGAPATAWGGRCTGLRARCRRLVTNPFVRNTAAIVLTAGQPRSMSCSHSFTRSFRGPHFHRSRASTISASASAVTRVGELCGRRL